MFYYENGVVMQDGCLRKEIISSETKLDYGVEMAESEAVALLTEYANADRVKGLKKMLAETDYISCKIAEGSATVEEYAEKIAQRQQWRAEINQLEA